MTKPNVALLQLTSSDDLASNLAQLEQQLQQLPSSIKLVVTPENTLLFANTAAYRAIAEIEGRGPLQQAVARLARQYKCWLLIGSMPMICKQNPNQMTNSSLLFDDQGQLKARYDKLHLFDVDVSDTHGAYRESASYQHGQQIVVVDTPVGRLGMSICYDLRFPGLFQALRDQGAELMVVPAAFTQITGAAHWQVLLQARAIENQCWVLAPAQVGQHSADRITWGHTLAVDPWGSVVAENTDTVVPLMLYIETQTLRQIRQKMPVAQHNRFQPVLVNSWTNSGKKYESDICQ